MAADEKATFAIELQDETSGAANTAAKALEGLKAKIAEGKKALSEMQAAQRNMKGGAGAAAEAQKALGEKIAAQKASLAAAQAQYVKLGGTFGSTTPKVAQAGSAFDALLGEVKGLPGPLGAMGGRLAALGGPAGIAAAAIGAVVGAMAALVAAAVAATAALLRYGVAQANARRNEGLRLEGLTTLRRWYGLAAGNASEMQAAIDRVSDATGAGRGELEGYTARLYRMGLRGEQLSQALEGVQLAASVQGEQGAARFLALAAGIARTGGEVRRLTESYQARLGPIARRQMLSLDVQTRRLHQSLERLFSGLRIETFLQGVQSILTVFSQTTVTGRALKNVVESLFQPLIDFAAGPVALHIKRFFQGMVLGALLFERQILRLRIWLRDTFGPGSVLDGLDTEMLAFRVGAAAVLLLVAAVATAATVLVAFGAAAVAAVAVVSGPIVTFFAFVAGIGAAVAAGLQAIVTMDWAGLGRSIVDGLLAGLRAGAARIRGAVTGLGNTVRQTFRDVLQIRSPSRVFADLGEQIPAGVTLGIEAGSAEASGAAAGLVEAPAGVGGGARGASISIGEVHIHADTSDPEEHARSFVDRLAELLEGTAITMGAAT